MRTSEIKDTYMLNTLRSLPKEKKIEIIAFLSNSLLEGTPTNQGANWVDLCSGTWTDDRDADDIVADIRNSRTQNSDIAKLFE